MDAVAKEIGQFMTAVLQLYSEFCTRQTARSSCQQLGADLVTINNAGTQSFLESMKIY